MKAYFISGIGADHRLFRYIRLPEAFEPIHLSWIEPARSEPLAHYAGRLAEKIDVDEPFVLIGLSLGGIMASEIAKISSPLTTIIISSVPVSKQLPPYFSLINRMRLHRLAHPAIGKMAAACKHLFTRGAENRKFIMDMIRDGDNKFISWGINAVLNWKNDTVPERLVHIHGKSDEVFPVRYVKPDYILKGSHSIVLSRSGEVNNILHRVLNGIPPSPGAHH